MGRRRLYGRLLSHVRPYWWIFVLAIASMAIQGATEPAMVALSKPLLDGTFVERSRDAVLVSFLLMLGVFLVRGLTGFTTQVGMKWVSHRVVFDIRARMFDRLIALPTSFFDRNPAGVTLSKLTYDVRQVASATSDALITLVRDSFVLLGLLGWMFYSNWKLTLILLVAAPVISYLILSIGRRLRRLATRLQHSMAEINCLIEEVIYGNKVMKMYSGQEYEARRFEGANRRIWRFEMKTALTDAAGKPAVQIIAGIALMSAGYFALRQTLEGAFTLGGFVSYFGALGMILKPLRSLTGVNATLQRGLAAAESVFRFLEEPPEKDEGSAPARPVRGAIEYRGVSFAYDEGGATVLRDATFTVAAGETVAIVGASGSGKTTLVHLLPRLYSSAEGRITIDGEDVRNFSLRDLRANIALVSQDIVLFNDTVAANIAYGALSGAPQERVESAAEAAGAMEFIRKLPQGFDTVIGDRGIRLSAGQRQRLSLARAFLKDAPILILDEPTSSLDTKSDAQIQEALERIRRGRTTIIIAHRLSTIERADRIFVVEGGEFVEFGTHEELMKKGGQYRELHEAQLRTGGPSAP